MNTITLDSGFKYQSFWGGELCQPSEELLKRHNYEHVWGDYNAIREYHDLTLLTVDGMQWIKEHQIDPNHPREDCAHHDYYSTCGYYHIAVHHNHHDEPMFYTFKASMRRENMQSTFGDYVFSGREDRNTFKSFEDAAKAIAAKS